jgi:hypothetical protein
MHYVALISLFLAVAPIGGPQVPAAQSAIEGTVVDGKTGLPLAGVRVIGPEKPQTASVVLPPRPTGLVQIGTLPPDSRQYFETTTNSEGRFRMDGVEAGKPVVLRFSKSGFIILNESFQPGVGLDSEVVRLTPYGVIQGRATNRRGEPVSNVRVAAYSYKFSNAGLYQALNLGTAMTNDRGEFRLISLVPGRYMVSFEPLPPPSGRSELHTSADDPERTGVSFALYPGVGEVAKAEWVDVVAGSELRLKDVVLGLTPRGVVRVHLTDRGEAQGPSSVDIALVPYNTSVAVVPVRPPDAWVRVLPGPAKSYWPPNPGLFQAQARWIRSDGNSAQVATTFEYTGAEKDVSISLAQSLGVLNVHTRLSQADGTTKPLPEMTLGFCRRDELICTATFEISGTTKEDGNVTFTRIPAGLYDLTHLFRLAPDLYLAEARQGDRDALVNGFMVSADDTPMLALTFRAGSPIVRGRVIDRSGAVVVGAVVGLIPEAPLDSSRLRDVQRSVRTDRKGVFEFSGGVIPNRYRVYAWDRSTPVDAHLNPAFMESFRGSGTHVVLEEGQSTSTADIVVLP